MSNTRVMAVPQSAHARELSPAAASVPPPSPGTLLAVASGAYTLTACHDGTGRPQRGAATVFVAEGRTYIHFRRVATTKTSRAIHNSAYELDRASGLILHAGLRIGSWQTTSEAELILVFDTSIEIWARA